MNAERLASHDYKGWIQQLMALRRSVLSVPESPNDRLVIPFTKLSIFFEDAQPASLDVAEVPPHALIGPEAGQAAMLRSGERFHFDLSGPVGFSLTMSTADAFLTAGAVRAQRQRTACLEVLSLCNIIWERGDGERFLKDRRTLGLGECIRAAGLRHEAIAVAWRVAETAMRHPGNASPFNRQGEMGTWALRLAGRCPEMKRDIARHLIAVSLVVA